MHLINEGGPLFMITLLILLIITIIFITKSLKNNNTKNLELLKSISLFALVFGFFGFILGLINALDMISDTTNIAPGMLAGGFKRGILSPTLGTFIFNINYLAKLLK